MNIETPAYMNYWGKASKKNDGLDFHLLAFHSLDVAAVGKILLEKNPYWLNSFSLIIGINKEILKPVILFFLTLHDLGKFSESFQSIRPDLLEKLQGVKESKKRKYSKRSFGHDSIGFLIWKESIFNNIVSQFSIEKSEEWKDLLNWFMEASNGHHGYPSKHENQCLLDYFKDVDIQATKDFTTECLVIFKIYKFFEITNILVQYDDLYEQLPKASWMLAGFYVLCDWIGSGKNFNYCYDSTVSLHDYWNKTAIPAAQKAISMAGILPCLPNVELDPLGTLLTLPKNSKLTPLQNLASTIEIPEKPQLFIIEDETGAGKTEASLILINRLMAKGLASGFYVALPTMATADGLYPRVKETYGKMFRDDQEPSLVLSHSAAKLTEKFTETILYPDSIIKKQEYNDDAQSRCQAWLTDNRKKSLLANVGVGTIDQAFLAILKVKYQSLRLIGLLGKILLIDEAHAYDAYMGKELEMLLKVHATMGGSAIVMSATLPIAIREALTNAYLKGLNNQNELTLSSHAYPLLTHITSDSKPGIQCEIPCKINPRKKAKSIHYQFIHEKDKIHDLITNSLEKGLCICWIRNSVKDARESYQIWNELHDNVILFHARFVLADRLGIQEKVLSLFNNKSTFEKRQSQLLIATQVVEQSLDLDFDVMITDLAPIDLMLQRAGRLHRHTRDKNGNPLEHGVDERASAMLTIFSPELNDNPNKNWFAEKFPNAKYVYRNHARLWMGLNELNKIEEKIIPKNLKPLIESVYGNANKVPEGLASKDTHAQKNEQRDRSHAGFNTINFELGYTQDNQIWAEDLSMPTRLGEETITLTLAKWQENQLKYFGCNPRHAWQKTEIRVLKKFVSSLPKFNAEQQRAFDSLKPFFPGQGRWTKLLPMVWDVDHECWQGKVINAQGEETSLFYHSNTGLVYTHEMNQKLDKTKWTEDDFI